VDIGLLEKLSNAFGPSGYEDHVREIIVGEISGQFKYDVDNLGNIIVRDIKGEELPTVVLDAHMDEVGLLITHIDKNGFLRFEMLGGIDTRILLSQRVKILAGDHYVYGVIGAKAPHLLKHEEKTKIPDFRALFIDIGASSRDEVRELGVTEGSVAVFDSQFIKQGSKIFGKAFDDRVGCYMLLELLKLSKDLPINIIGIFSIQEEVGLRGARALSHIIEADYAIALECTAAADTPGVPEHDYSTRLRGGPALTIADKASISHPKFLRAVIDIAQRNDIPYQFKERMVGGTDASMYQYVRLGIPSITISVPSRYIHSACSVADVGDIEHTISLVHEVLREIGSRGRLF